MSKDNQIIMVVDTEKLFNGKYFIGFRNSQENNFEKNILSNYTFMRRGDAEKDTNFKQPIAYALIVNPNTKKVFAYQRSVRDSGEQRLYGKWSLGIGGHIEKVDHGKSNPIYESLLREVEEEVYFEGKVNPKVLGYVNDDSNSVGKVHFGILYIIETDFSEIIPKSSEIAIGELKSFDDLEKMLSTKNLNLETWSEIAIDPLRKYFNN